MMRYDDGDNCEDEATRLGFMMTNRIKAGRRDEIWQSGLGTIAQGIKEPMAEMIIQTHEETKRQISRTCLLKRV